MPPITYPVSIRSNPAAAYARKYVGLVLESNTAHNPCTQSPAENWICRSFDGEPQMGEVRVNSRGAFRSGKDFCVVNDCGFGSMVRPSLVNKL